VWDHPRDNILLEKSEEADQQSEKDTMLEGSPKNIALLSNEFGDGDTGCDILR
jgi:hypothetical protein